MKGAGFSYMVESYKRACSDDYQTMANTHCRIETTRNKDPVGFARTLLLENLERGLECLDHFTLATPTRIVIDSKVSVTYTKWVWLSKKKGYEIFVGICNQVVLTGCYKRTTL